MQTISQTEEQQILYEDKYCRITPKKITLFHYHIFFGMSKDINIKDIKEVRLKNADGWVKYRWWGFSLKHWWRYFPLDVSRHKKDKFIEMDLGKLVIPALTPDDIEKVYEILQELVTGKAVELKEKKKGEEISEEQDAGKEL